MIPTTLTRGDLVLWRGKFGEATPQVVRVTRIDYAPTAHAFAWPSVEVAALSWPAVLEDRAMVDLDNGHWAWGSQLEPIDLNRLWERKQDTMDALPGVLVGRTVSIEEMQAACDALWYTLVHPPAARPETHRG